MNGMIKLTQSNGKALLLPAQSIRLVQSQSLAERAQDPGAFSSIWFDRNGTLVSANLADKFGYVMRLTGGLAGRAQLTTPDDKFILLAPYLISMVQEVDTDNGQATLVLTALQFQNAQGGQTAITFLAVDSVDDIASLMGLPEQAADEGDDVTGPAGGPDPYQSQIDLPGVGTAPDPQASAVVIEGTTQEDTTNG